VDIRSTVRWLTLLFPVLLLMDTTTKTKKAADKTMIPIFFIAEVVLKEPEEPVSR
jgi:hypothetical protein